MCEVAFEASFEPRDARLDLAVERPRAPSRSRRSRRARRFRHGGGDHLIRGGFVGLRAAHRAERLGPVAARARTRRRAIACGRLSISRTRSDRRRPPHASSRRRSRACGTNQTTSTSTKPPAIHIQAPLGRRRSSRSARSTRTPSSRGTNQLATSAQNGPLLPRKLPCFSRHGLAAGGARSASRSSSACS